MMTIMIHLAAVEYLEANMISGAFWSLAFVLLVGWLLTLGDD